MPKKKSQKEEDEKSRRKSHYYDNLITEDSDEEDANDTTTANLSLSMIPGEEDLSLCRNDEETVLQAVYAQDFCKEPGSSWGVHVYNIKVKPPDLQEQEVGCRLTLNVKLGKRYPYVAPTIRLLNVQGLDSEQEKELLSKINKRANDLASLGSVMVCELVQETEDYLLSHNRNPLLQNISAWEEMKKREEAFENERKQAILFSHEKEGFTDASSNTYNTASGKPNEDHSETATRSTVLPSDDIIQRELQRQMQELNLVETTSASPHRLQRQDESQMLSFHPHSDDEEDSDDFDEDSTIPVNDNHITGPRTFRNSSRFHLDFCQLGLLGRGGGGEVVKCRNRLDRRVYAIKKVTLETEQGTFAKVAAERNRKLFREVTTISRMVHPNIVRYYQAWLEGGEVSKEDEGDETAASEMPNTLENDGIVDNERQSFHAADDDESEEMKSWWRGNGSREKDDGRELDENDSSNYWEKDDESGNLDRLDTLQSFNDDHIFNVVPSPLLVGFNVPELNYGITNAHGPSSKTTFDILGSSPPSQNTADEYNRSNEKRILYIQMEYCNTTLRKLIDEGFLSKRPGAINEVWRLTRQLIDALVYIHSRSIIHRDLKPSNVFLDSERNVRIGDFGLATTHRMTIVGADTTSKHDEDEQRSAKITLVQASEEEQRSQKIDIGDSLDVSLSDYPGETLTGGVGTTFYRAPEQEGKGEKYGVKVDIYSLGIILFEMFHHPFKTQSERIHVLARLRQDEVPGSKNILHKDLAQPEKADSWREDAKERFPEDFMSSVPENAQRLILSCLEKNPTKRPSAAELIKSDLIPRKIELENTYLQEALQIISNPQSESYGKILSSLFSQATPQHVELMFDTDACTRADIAMKSYQKEKSKKLDNNLISALDSLGSARANTELAKSLTMSSIAIHAVTSSLHRSQGIGKAVRAGKEGEFLRGVPQCAAIAVAMTAATTASVTGGYGGYNSDPRVVQFVCDNLQRIFELHGAVQLVPPLFRPRSRRSEEFNYAHHMPVELLNKRGTVVMLPEGLTANFARSIARSGNAATRVKRYCFDKVYHDSVVGGHPRENLDASFDIVFEDPYVTAEYLEAEVFMVICQSIGSLKSPKQWYLRLTHTRLADSILDFCGVGSKETLRNFCLRILGCGSFSLVAEFSKGGQKSRRGKGPRANDIDRHFDHAVTHHELSVDAARRLRAFMSGGCFPLPVSASDAVDAIQEAARKLRLRDIHNNDAGPKRTKKYEEIGRGLRSLRKFIDAVRVLETVSGQKHGNRNINSKPDVAYCPPAFIAIDLSLRQDGRHFHGSIFFQAFTFDQCALLKYIQNDETLVRDDDAILTSGITARVAEGGRYDDLVRMYRPPGSHYSSAPIPVAVGVVFFLEKLMSLINNDATTARLSEGQEMKKQNTLSIFDNIRQGLAHPLPVTIKCVVASVNGLDSASTQDRAMVAMLLWAAGIPAEYLPQSSTFTSLMQHCDRESNKLGAFSSEMSLDQLCGLCGVFNIPFVVIVQSHLLKDKAAVRLRPVFDLGNEEFIPLASLAVNILDRLASVAEVSSIPHFQRSVIQDRDVSGAASGAREAPSNAGTLAKVECFFVDSENYVGQDTAKHESRSKSTKKALKTATQRAEAYLSDLAGNSIGSSTPVFAVDLPLRVLREYGTLLMDNGTSIANARDEISQKYPKHKRQLKVLSSAIDSVLRRRGASHEKKFKNVEVSVSQQPISMFFYSTSEDRFDLVSLPWEATVSAPSGGRREESQDVSAEDTAARANRNSKRTR